MTERSLWVSAHRRAPGRVLADATLGSLGDLLHRATTAGVPAHHPYAAMDSAAAQSLLIRVWDDARDALRGCLADPAQAPRAEALLSLLGDLRRMSDDLRDEQWRERERSFGRVRDALALLRDVESSTELVDQAVVAVCQLGFDRAIVSRVENDLWIAQSVYVGRDVRWAEEILAASQANPQVVDAALIEAEIVRTRGSVLVTDVQDLPNVNRPIADASQSRSYVAAPIIAHGAVVGFLHADCYYQGRALDETDRATLTLFGEGLGYALARTAVLDRLAALHADLGRLSSGTNQLWPSSDAAQEPARRLVLPDALGEGGLTRREVEVVRWMARGETNGRIARRLMITEGTVKTHVQSILRKLGAANRAEAVYRWADRRSRTPHIDRGERPRDGPH